MPYRNYKLFYLPLVFPFLLFSQSQEADYEITYPEIDTVTISSSLPQFILRIEYDTLKNRYADLPIYEDYILKLSIYELGKSSPNQTIIDTIENQPNIKTDDINMDGYTDIRLDYGYFNLTPTYDFLLFQPAQNKFIYSDDFSGLHDYSLSPTFKEIESSFYDTGGKGGSTERFRVVNNHLILIESLYSDRDECEKKELINDSLQVTKQTSVDTDEDSNGVIIYIVTEKERVYDSLYTIRKTWKRDYEANSNRVQKRIGLFESNPWSNGYYLFSKEEYGYKKLKNGNIKQSIKRFEIVNNKWKLK